jgi:hypothetical protein
MVDFTPTTKHKRPKRVESGTNNFQLFFLKKFFFQTIEGSHLMYSLKYFVKSFVNKNAKKQ